MNRRKVVRIVQTTDNEGGYIDSAFISSLAAAGLIDVHETDPNGMTVHCFDLQAPLNVNDDTWAEMNAKRMSSLGFNAVVAFSTRD